ncbi:hypothetical protein BJY16_006121 [Actinoplanes octamycinicus]|uniref:Uncharacterized protein n=1 Tax=Actinoplanes octamycinicus TaxID=135948 RepID=A0A7W7H2F9_9ACTN|nr:hypothetical protein [Actinoplanes octamycinicus]MBB4742662.1 hypothetical protein [Actinoplanes octamycinicus]GIE61000.1 hypothetical protein Aoc01nite_64020 [Actinoplanes octamycinicus]
MAFPYARTFDEVLAYVGERPCVCGATETEIENRTGEAVLIGGVSAVRFSFTCGECAKLREFTFRMTEEEAARPPGFRVLGLARTAAEAHLFMDLHECDVCGEAAFDRDFGVVIVDGEPCSRYSGRCPGCGNPREFVFRLPDETPIPDPAQPSFGGDKPSELLDAGEWLSVADAIAADTPAEPAGMDAEERQQARYDLLTAAAAVAEARKFVAAGTEAVSPEALWSPTGRAVYEADSGRFCWQRLDLVENVYREIAVTFGD